MKPTKEDWDRFGREIMTGGRSEDVTTERNDLKIDKIREYAKGIDNFWFEDAEKNLLCHRIKDDILEILDKGE